MPSCSAKINFLLGLEERTQRDNTLGGLFNQNMENFSEIFFSLVEKSQKIKQPVTLFTLISEEQVAKWRLRFGGKQEKEEKKE